MGDPMLIKARIVPGNNYLFLLYCFEVGGQEDDGWEGECPTNRQTNNY